MNQKFNIKFEKGAYEQTYKLSELDMVEGVNGVFKLIDEVFIGRVVAQFAHMRSDFNEAYIRAENG